MDSRDTAGYSPFDRYDSNTMTGWIDGLAVKCHMEVCPICDGQGKHINPSIDSNGISAEEFYEDPDFAEAYMGGVYDVSCYECHGLRVVPVPNDEDQNKSLYDAAIQDHYDYMAECEAERRMGC